MIANSKKINIFVENEAQLILILDLSEKKNRPRMPAANIGRECCPSKENANSISFAPIFIMIMKYIFFDCRC